VSRTTARSVSGEHSTLIVRPSFPYPPQRNVSCPWGAFFMTVLCRSSMFFSATSPTMSTNRVHSPWVKGSSSALSNRMVLEITFPQPVATNNPTVINKMWRRCVIWYVQAMFYGLRWSTDIDPAEMRIPCSGIVVDNLVETAGRPRQANLECVTDFWAANTLPNIEMDLLCTHYRLDPAGTDRRVDSSSVRRVESESEDKIIVVDLDPVDLGATPCGLDVLPGRSFGARGGHRSIASQHPQHQREEGGQCSSVHGIFSPYSVTLSRGRDACACKRRDRRLQGDVMRPWSPLTHRMARWPVVQPLGPPRTDT